MVGAGGVALKTPSLGIVAAGAIADIIAEKSATTTLHIDAIADAETVGGGFGVFGG